MIDTQAETLIHFPVAGRHFPGRTVHIATLHRWRLHGCRGKKLETVLVGARRFTSVEAIRRFLAASNSEQAQPSATEQARRAREAGRALEAIGA